MSPTGFNLKTLPIEELADKFLKHLENIESCSPETLRAYRVDLAQAFLKTAHHEKISRQDPEAALLAVARAALLGWGHLSLATRNRKSATLKSFFGYLFQQGFIERDLSAQIHSPKVPKKIPNFISVDEVVAILQSFSKDEPSEHLDQEKTLFLLLYGAGLRVSEACALAWKNVDLKQRVLRILGKGGKERLVALPQNLANQLSHFKTNHKTEYLWGHEPLSTRKAYDWIRTRGAKAGLLKPIHPHALRHSYATHLLASGANLRTLQELLGHESLTATEKYTHLGVDQLARTLESHHPFGDHKKVSK